MPIIEVGNFTEISMTISAMKWNQPTVCPLSGDEEAVPQIKTEAVPSIPVPALSMELMHSIQRWAVYLKHITLTKSFEGWLASLFDPTNEIYFTVVAWDYSGKAPQIYPMHVEDPARLLHRVKTDGIVEFMGDGVCLWPSSVVVGALNLMIVVYECDKNIQKLGKTLTELHEKVKASALMDLIAAVSQNPALAVGHTVMQTVNEVSGIIGAVLKENADDSVGLFSGSYAVEKDWKSRVEKHVQDGVQIQLEFILTD